MEYLAAPAGARRLLDWLNPSPIDQRTLYQGNSVLRGQVPRIDETGADPMAQLVIK